MHWIFDKINVLIHTEVRNISLDFTNQMNKQMIHFNFISFWRLAGFTHRQQPSTIDLNAVRLCFQAFLEQNKHGKTSFSRPLKPVVSNIIYDKKAMSDLVICKLSKPSSSVAGGEEIILLCEKVREWSTDESYIESMICEWYNFTTMIQRFSF